MRTIIGEGVDEAGKKLKTVTLEVTAKQARLIEAIDSNKTPNNREVDALYHQMPSPQDIYDSKAGGFTVVVDKHDERYLVGDHVKKSAKQAAYQQAGPKAETEKNKDGTFNVYGHRKVQTEYIVIDKAMLDDRNGFKDVLAPATFGIVSRTSQLQTFRNLVETVGTAMTPQEHEAMARFRAEQGIPTGSIVIPREYYEGAYDIAKNHSTVLEIAGQQAWPVVRDAAYAALHAPLAAVGGVVALPVGFVTGTGTFVKSSYDEISAGVKDFGSNLKKTGQHFLDQTEARIQERRDAAFDSNRRERLSDENGVLMGVTTKERKEANEWDKDTYKGGALEQAGIPLGKQIDKLARGFLGLFGRKGNIGDDMKQVVTEEVMAEKLKQNPNAEDASIYRAGRVAEETVKGVVKGAWEHGTHNVKKAFIGDMAEVVAEAIADPDSTAIADGSLHDRVDAAFDKRKPTVPTPKEVLAGAKKKLDGFLDVAASAAFDAVAEVEDTVKSIPGGAKATADKVYERVDEAAGRVVTKTAGVAGATVVAGAAPGLFGIRNVFKAVKDLVTRKTTPHDLMAANVRGHNMLGDIDKATTAKEAIGALATGFADIADVLAGGKHGPSGYVGGANAVKTESNELKTKWSTRQAIDSQEAEVRVAGSKPDDSLVASANQANVSLNANMTR